MTQPLTPARQIMTVLDARVPPEQWGRLQQLYEAGLNRLPPQMVRTMLVQSASDRNLWRSISVWRSAEALSEYRRAVQVPKGLAMFRAVGAEPVWSLFDVVMADAQPGDAGPSRQTPW
ncbi:MAG: hypothetical protein IT318_17805 [Anaerolineales bacterium]|nr:hypothetical protein [Anaerolineales bacterium]